MLFCPFLFSINTFSTHSPLPNPFLLLSLYLHLNIQYTSPICTVHHIELLIPPFPAILARVSYDHHTSLSPNDDKNIEKSNMTLQEQYKSDQESGAKEARLKEGKFVSKRGRTAVARLMPPCFCGENRWSQCRAVMDSWEWG
jgi:hypothetical protein